jgi:oligopeptide/dipeptide ABC transporter ATP-binding protein
MTASVTAPVVDQRADPLLRLEGVAKTFGSSKPRFFGRDTSVRAVDGVSLDLYPGEALGLVGESGSGKTTIGRMIVKLIEPTGGRILFRGADIAALDGNAQLAYRRSVQMVFQNPFASLNPRRRVRDMIRDAYEIHGIASGADADARMAALMETVGLRPNLVDRYPHQFSSGQRQRIGIARALSVGPTLVVADEPTSALDVSVQAQVLNLVKRLQADLGLAVVFISHDLRAVAFLCERIAILYLGQVMEIAPRRALIDGPAHPYTQALFSSIPSLAPGRGVTRQLIRGEISEHSPAPGGCVFAPRCELRRRLGDPGICVTERPPLVVVTPGQSAACHFTKEAARTSLRPGESVLPQPAG